MFSIGAFEAKTHLSDLLRRVSEGETIEITKRGIPIAVLTPPLTRSKKDPRRAAEEIRRARKGCKLGGISIKELIEEGRRY